MTRTINLDIKRRTWSSTLDTNANNYTGGGEKIVVRHNSSLKPTTPSMGATGTGSMRVVMGSSNLLNSSDYDQN